MILSVLGCPCRGGVTGYAVGTGGTSSSVGRPPEKRLRTLSPVRWSMDLVERALMELRFAAEGRRRKSVRIEWSSETIGPEIPIIAPVEERWDLVLPVLGS